MSAKILVKDLKAGHCFSVPNHPELQHVRCTAVEVIYGSDNLRVRIAESRPILIDGEAEVIRH